ncbi:MAG: TadE/TadG family type IV pilus assembly protein [Firmicutes bacterium]|nr:TadE/TadG family type IV pilus assembly protein [Bacillota bacterium]
MKLIRSLKRENKESGQSLVEFALVIPILLIFILGILEYGWLLNAKITLTSAAREGVRAAVVSTVSRDSRAFDAADKAVTGTSGITLVNDSTHYNYYEEEDTVNNVRNAIVEIKGNVKPLIGIFVDDPFEINAKAIMRIE